MKKRAVLYARVSSEDRSREGRNLKGQLEMCRQYAMQHGWRIVAELAEDDRGASGASFELLQLNRVYEMARADEFDILVVREIDRLSRRLAKQLIVEEELKRHGIQIEYVLGEYADTPEGNLMKNVKASVAEYERLKITERMVRGRRQKAKAGSVILHGHAPPYGYRRQKEDGKSMLVVHEQEARIVRMMFEWYVRGGNGNGPNSIHGIARELTKLGIPTAMDRCKNQYKIRGYGVWSPSVIRNMLSNETYAGTWYYGKGKHINKKYAPNPDSYLIPVDVPAIVDRETWELAQSKRDQNRQKVGRKPRFQYLLTGHLKCGRCGYKMFGRTTRRTEHKVYQYYNCPGRDSLESARQCSLAPFRVDKVDAVVWEWIKAFLTDPAALADGMSTFQNEIEERNAPIRQRLEVVDQLLARDQEQLDRLLDLYLAGDFPREILIERKARLEKTVKSLEVERDGLKARLEAEIPTEEQLRDLQTFATEVADGLQAAEKDFETRREIVKTLNVEVTLTEENGDKVVYASCLLGEDVLPFLSSST